MLRRASWWPPATALILTLAVSACGGDDLSRNFGITRDTPDEFTVTTRAPLSMPPDLTLRPPRPGAPRPQEQTPDEAAEAALVPQSALAGDQTGGETPGQKALIAAAGPPAPSNIRRKVEEETALETPGHSITDRLMFWRKPPPPGIVVDPQKEAQRLRANAALGVSVETGDTPIIQRSSAPGLLNGIF